MYFILDELTEAEQLKLRMLQVKASLRKRGFAGSRGVIRLYCTLYPEAVNKTEYAKLRNVYALTSTDKQIIERFESLAVNLESILETHG